MAIVFRLIRNRTARALVHCAAIFCAMLTLPVEAQATNPPPPAASQVVPGKSASISQKGVTPAPTHSRQNQILSSALTPQTRQTLQEAMDSARTADTSHPAPAPPAK
jgi:hypothetical protein